MFFTEASSTHILWSSRDGLNLCIMAMDSYGYTLVYLCTHICAYSSVLAMEHTLNRAQQWKPTGFHPVKQTTEVSVHLPWFEPSFPFFLLHFSIPVNILPAPMEIKEPWVLTALRKWALSLQFCLVSSEGCRGTVMALGLCFTAGSGGDILPDRTH